MLSTQQISPDGVRLIATRAVRGFVDGLISVSLAAYFTLLGYSGLRIGVIVTGMLLGSAALTLLTGLYGHRYTRRALLLSGCALMIATGLTYALLTSFVVFFAMGVIGTMNPSSGDVSVFLPLEQSLLPTTVADAGRTAVFARYAFVGSFFGAVGSLAAGVPEWLGKVTSTAPTTMVRSVFGIYALGGLAMLIVYRSLSPAIEPPPHERPQPLGDSRRIVYRLAAVFSLDAFGGGFVVQSLLALWLFRRFDLSLGAAGALLFWTGTCSALSAFVSARIAKRIGLIRTMVFTHLPAQVLLIAAALMPNLALAVTCLIARSLLSAMDVPARNSYVMAVVSPGERAAAASVTNVPRSLASALPPIAAGWMLDHSTFGWPLIIAGALKAGYDVTLLFMFRNIRPPEEQSQKLSQSDLSFLTPELVFPRRPGNLASRSLNIPESQEQCTMAKAVGIDLGTTNSVVAFLEAGEPVVIPNSEGARTTPSVVAFSKAGEVLVGEVAKRQAITNSDRTFRSVKRHIGSNWKSDDIDGKRYTAQEISARTLMKLKRDAEAYCGDVVTQAVITVPAYFDDAQRTATKEAGQIAGLEVLRIINEPTAAALAYGLDKGTEDETILVFDLGGGTFDVSVLEIGDGVFEVKSTHGDTKLGGDDWDQRIIDWLVQQFKSAHGVDLANDRMATQRLKEAAEKAKIELSQVAQTQINLPFITATADGPLHLDESLTRAKFQEMTADLIERCRIPFEQALKDAGVTKGQLSHVILVGGSTRMPAVGDLVTSLTGKEPNKSVNPDEVVAVGAAIQAGVLKGDVKDVLLLDVTPLSLGIETKGGVMTKLIERNTTIPTRRTEVFTTAEDMQPSVEIHVLQGEREMAGYNKTLGKFQLVDLPPAPRGIPQIEVTFDIDANGIVHVSAKDRATNKEQSMTISGQSTLNKDDIERMVKDAEAHAEEDRQRREEVEIRNNGDSLLYQTEKVLREQGDKVSADERTAVETPLAELKTALAGNDVAAIKSATEALAAASQVFSQKLYENAARDSNADGSSASGQSSAANDDEIIDAEIVDDK